MLKDNKFGLLYSKKAAELSPDYFEANINTAVSAHRLNYVDTAFKYYMRALNLNPNQTRIYSGFNDLLSKNNMVEQGIEGLIGVAENMRNPKNMYMNIANLYSINTSNLDSSIHYFVKAYNYDVNDKVLCNHIVKLFSMKGDLVNQNLYQKKCGDLN